jgi:hypothetical protein
VICTPCKEDRHQECEGGTWCDCQHADRTQFPVRPRRPHPVPREAGHVSDADDRPRRPDTPGALTEDAKILFEARRILEGRFTSGKHDGTARALRSAATELIARSRHPSRQVPS